MGRPRLEVDWEEAEKLCGLQCTGPEMAGWFGISLDTLEQRIKEKYEQTFAEFFDQRRHRGFVSLRRMQWVTAQNGSVTMQIYLGKVLLKQRDRDSRDEETLSLVPSAGSLESALTIEELTAAVKKDLFADMATIKAVSAEPKDVTPVTVEDPFK